MPRTILPIAEWQRKLNDAFVKYGIAGGSLLDLTSLEEQAGAEFVRTYIGFRYLSDCCQSFAFDTLKLTAPESVVLSRRRLASFASLYVEMLMLFRRIRSAHITAVNGYPSSGPVLLRDVKDRSLFISAIFQEHLSYEMLLGVTPGEPQDLDPKALHEYRRKKRLAIEKELVEKYLTKNTSFDNSTLRELNRWNNLFNWETHGSFLSQANAMIAWVNGDAYPKIVETSTDMLALLMNRFCETVWLFHRLLPNLQYGDGFGEEWGLQWRLLDDSFWQMQKGLAGIGKGIGDAFVVFIDKVFPFDEHTRQPLADQR